jgi:transaldolase
MDDVAAAGVDLADVFKVLEDEGVEKFEASWGELLEDVKKSLKAAAKGADNPSDAAKS